jgi:imidazolonepropionase-like amidohydrolase/Tol biopolymer transport system component
MLILISLMGISYKLTAQDSEKWDVNQPPGEFKELKINTSEGTWMNLDVSPDGQKIVFDMLGDIFIIPVTGGKATALRTGHAFEVQPRFSPDGSKISFTSDAGGGDNIWTMNADGSDAKQITKEDFRLLNNAVWTPDGQYLIARKHFTSQRSLGAGELWMYHITGGSGIQLSKKKNEQQDTGEPWVSGDGKYVYYSEDMYPGEYFQYNKDPNSQIYAIKRYNLEDGKTERVTGGPGGAVRPQTSPNGNLLAFVKRVRTKSVLYLHDLSTGEEWPVFDDLSKDQQEAWAIFGLYPNFNWTPDGTSLIIWSKGGFKKINANSLQVTEIPFEVEVTHKLTETVKFENNPSPDNLEIKVIRNAVTSPDGKTLVFQAAGYLWKKQLPDDTPTRLTSGVDLESEPSYSKDGGKITYVTWNDEEMGAIYTYDLRARRSTPVKITNEKGIYRTPSFSPDGTRIVYRKEGSNGHQGSVFNKEPGIYWISTTGGKATKIISEGENPQFNSTGDRIFYQTGGQFFGSLEKTLKSTDLNGKETREILKSKYANRFVVSPDNKWILFSNLFKAYVAPMPTIGKVLDLDINSKSVPISLVASDAGYNLHWASDGRKVYWTLGNEYFSSEINQRFTFLDGSPDEVGKPDSTGIKIGLVLDVDKPQGRIAFTGATIITMNEDNEVISNGTIIVSSNRIEAIGNSSIDIPSDAKIYDVGGKVIMPGIVDAHAHVGAFRYGLSPQKHWQYYANLAYGVTTTHDPSANTEMALGQSEMVMVGEMVGPRIFSTGIILYGAEGDFKAVINSLDDARSAIRRTKAFGAFSVKSYNQPRREQRQQVITAARELGIHVYPEGGSTFFHNLTMILDGHTGIEHNLPVYPLYKDVLELYGASGSGYTPTLVVNYGSITGEHYWYQTSNVWEKDRLMAFTPRSIIDTRSRHRTMIPMEEYKNGHILSAEACKALTDAGVKVNLGAHGQLQGLGAHWELWMFAQGGMTPMESLRAATINGAEYLGMGKDLGSLEEGKLADLIVLEKNPLDDIRNSEHVVYTMVNGRIYDAATLNQVGNYDKPRSKFYWENVKNPGNFPWHQTSFSIETNEGQCSCRTTH